MIKLANTIVLSTALSLFAASAFVLPSLAQGTDTAASDASTKAAPAKKAVTAKKRNARKRAKLKSDASKTIEKGVDKANTNLNK